MIQILCRLSTLEDIAQYQGMSAAFMVGTAAHEIERDVERVDIRVVAVVDKGAAMLSLLHLQSHGDRLEQCHALVEFLGRKTQAA